MLAYEELYEKLWIDYSDLNPSVKRIHELFNAEGETVENDHIAFRTFNDPRVNIEVMEKSFLEVGYTAVAEYDFKAKKLRAVHYENPAIENAPKVFISELRTEAFSNELQATVKDILD